MRSQDIDQLLAQGWNTEVVNVLISMNYVLDEINTVEGTARFTTSPASRPSRPEHGFTLHRNDPPWHISQQIFEAGELEREAQVGDCLRKLHRLGGLQLR